MRRAALQDDGGATHTSTPPQRLFVNHRASPSPAQAHLPLQARPHFGRGCAGPAAAWGLRIKKAQSSALEALPLPPTRSGLEE
ncbi:hypothetical protein U9M48_022507 [Paspalum notatum var. saurae]|uniref:Uncharacterized protein n=1 Tax=Paspalum notatum var. saurae TaxID=547442 RepID=A0AAQ3WUT5_PASNO